MGETWSKLGINFNRFIQKYRRLHKLPIQYIRTVEAHADTYPHIHIILQFPDARISVDNARYFDSVLYRKWKQLWTFGLSDYQPPRNTRQPILYLIKYISKETHTYKTLWKKMLPPADATVIKDGHGPIHAPTVQDTTTNKTLELCKTYKVKQLSWSRGFVFPSLARRPETEIEQTLLTVPRN